MINFLLATAQNFSATCASCRRSARCALDHHHDRSRSTVCALLCSPFRRHAYMVSGRNAHAKAEAALGPGLRQTSHAIVRPLRPPFLSFSLPPSVAQCSLCRSWTGAPHSCSLEPQVYVLILVDLRRVHVAVICSFHLYIDGSPCNKFVQHATVGFSADSPSPCAHCKKKKSRLHCIWMLQVLRANLKSCQIFPRFFDLLCCSPGL